MAARKDWTHCKNGHLLDKQNTIIERNVKTKNGLQRRCKICCLAYKRLKGKTPERCEWRKKWRKPYDAKNKASILAMDLKRRSKDRTSYNLKSRARRYGLSTEQLQEMYLAQDGLCAICKQKKPLSVDHNHTTGKVRALLCHGCNTGLGCFEENPRLLYLAIAYIVKHIEIPEGFEGLFPVPPFKSQRMVQ